MPSDYAMGAVLSQSEQPIGYMSKTFSKHERNYCPWRKELLAAFKAVKHFNHYIYGRDVELRTDNTAVQHFMTQQTPSNYVAQIVTELSAKGINITHRPGTQHKNADALSQMHYGCDQCNEKTRTKQVDVRHVEIQCTGNEEQDVVETIARVQTRQQKQTQSTQHVTSQEDEPTATLPNWKSEDLVLAQKKDPDILYVLERLEQGKKPLYHEISAKSLTCKNLCAEWERL